MLTEIIYPAIIRLIRAFPTGYPSRPNSFGAVSTFKDIDSDNLNASMKDGRIGHYWGRKWEASGKDSSQIKFENALIFIRKEAITFSERSKKTGTKVCQSLEIGIGSLPECEGCVTARGDNQIEVDNALVLNEIVLQLSRIEPFVLDIPENLGGVGVSTYWLVPAEVEWLKLQGVIFPTFKNCTATLTVKKTTDQFTSFTYGTAGMIITTSKIQVCWCDSTEVQYNFGLNEFNQAAFTACETC